MKIKSKISTDRIKGKRPPILIEYNGEWLTIKQLADRPELIRNNLNYYVLYERFRNPKVTEMEDLLRKKQSKMPKDTEFKIVDYGYHKECKKGEILAGYLYPDSFKLADFWGEKNQRLGVGIIVHGRFKGKLPYFIKRSAIANRGWVIV